MAYPNPDEAGPIVLSPMGLPITAGIEPESIVTPLAMQCLRPLPHSEPHIRSHRRCHNGAFFCLLTCSSMTQNLSKITSK